VVVLDYFADRDTLTVAPGSRSVAAAGALRFDRRKLLEAVDTLAPPGADPPFRLVYGAGLEGRVDLLRRLAVGRRLLGNPPEVLATFREPRWFFELLARLEIPHPEVRWSPPPEPAGWLEKHSGSAGGTRVRRATRRMPPSGCYFQRLVNGRSLSVLFLANGREARVLGFNQQWSPDHRPDRPFLYAGAVGQVGLNRGVRDSIEQAVHRLVVRTGLVGLNGLDFILNGDSWFALELNPRPTATVELYDADYPRGLFDWHLRACAGELPAAAAPSETIRAHAIVLAPVDLSLPPGFDFPEWCRDLPHKPASFKSGDPICTVHATEATVDLAMALARRRATDLQVEVTHPRVPVAHP
jgi:predicted ATP-grasp superfamily ATP-dependent carboligase